MEIRWTKTIAANIYFTYGESLLPHRQQIQHALQNQGSAPAELYFGDTPEVLL